MDNHRIVASLLKYATRSDAPGRPEDARWDTDKLSCYGFSILVATAEQGAKKITKKPDYVCGLRRSGLVLGILVAHFLEVPLLWFREPSIHYLFPKYLKPMIIGKNVLMVDSHVLTGTALMRYGSILQMRGAQLERPFVLADCDKFHNPGCAVWLQRHFDEELHCIIRLSELLSDTKGQERLIQIEPELANIIPKIIGSKDYWR